MTLLIPGQMKVSCFFFQCVVSFGSKAKGKYWQCIMDNKPHDLLHPLTYDKVITNSLQKLIQLFFDIQCKFFPSMNPFFASSTTQSEFLPILPPRLSWRGPNCCLFHLYEISLMITLLAWRLCSQYHGERWSPNFSLVRDLEPSNQMSAASSISLLESNKSPNHFMLGLIFILAFLSP